MKPLRIGISALDLNSNVGHLRAGVGLSVYQLIDKAIEADNECEFFIAVHPEFQVPTHWAEQSRINIIRPRPLLCRRRVVWQLIFAGLQAKKYKTDAWLATGSYGSLSGKDRQFVLVHDLLPITNSELFGQRQVVAQSFAVRQTIPRARRIFTNSHHTKSEVMRVFGIPDERIVVLPFSVGHTLPVATSEEVLGTSPSDLGIPFKRFFFALSTVEPRKDVGTILRAAALIRRQLEDAECGIAIAGAKGWKTDSVFETYTQLGLENLVTFLGYVPDEQIPILFAKSEAFLCASLTEGFGMPVLEAHIYGAPVICTTGGALKEVSGPGALTFEPKDEQALAQNMIDVLATPEQRQARVEKGREHAKSYSWVKCAEIVLETIKQECQRK